MRVNSKAILTNPIHCLAFGFGSGLAPKAPGTFGTLMAVPLYLVFVGFWITMLLAPAGWLWLLIGFVLFRLFDIWKPWPINVLDKNMETGLGIMLDDVLAGVYAFICLQGLVYLQATFNV